MGVMDDRVTETPRSPNTSISAMVPPSVSSYPRTRSSSSRRSIGTANACDRGWDGSTERSDPGTRSPSSTWRSRRRVVSSPTGSTRVTPSSARSDSTPTRSIGARRSATGSTRSTKGEGSSRRPRVPSSRSRSETSRCIACGSRPTRRTPGAAPSLSGSASAWRGSVERTRTPTDCSATRRSTRSWKASGRWATARSLAGLREPARASPRPRTRGRRPPGGRSRAE